SIAGQYMLEWESARYPEGGTFYGPVDFVFNGPNRQFLSPALGFASRGPASEPSQHGEFGLTARWTPAWLDGTAGLYYRNFADKLPQVLLTKVGPATVTSGGNLFMGVGYAPCVGKDKWDGCSTQNYVGIGASFTPTWFQVLPGVDLSAPVTYAIGVSGNAATTFGGNQGLGNYSLGV